MKKQCVCTEKRGGVLIAKMQMVSKQERVLLCVFSVGRTAEFQIYKVKILQTDLKC